MPRSARLELALDLHRHRPHFESTRGNTLATNDASVDRISTALLCLIIDILLGGSCRLEALGFEVTTPSAVGP